MSRTTQARKKQQMRRTIASTIGYSFVIVLVVLLVMSSVLTDSYTRALEIERGEAMKSCAVSCSAALSYVDIHENMSYPLSVYSYAEGKNYTVDIYTKAGNSFLRLYTSANTESIEDYTLTGAGEVYNDCFELQEVALTKRTENKIEYVCAIAPIISEQNTVSGILEIRMPMSDFTSTVNGMSLSWIFTIFAIAVSVGIIIYEINLLISTVSGGMKVDVPILIMYGKEACGFISFFFAFAAIMQPIVLAVYYKESLSDLNSVLVQVIIGVSLILYAFGFFGFKGLRKAVKEKFTSKVALLSVTVFGYFLTLVAGIVANPYVILALLLPISICNGMTYDYLRDYRINAGSLGYKEYDDRTIHRLQYISYFLGASVGTVLTGIFYERFGILVVFIVSGACTILTAASMLLFMRNNNPVRESPLPINKWLELIGNKYTGKLLMSAFFVLGIIFCFLIGFVPNYLETVGISLATSAFYYLLCAFVALFVMPIFKRNFENVLTSKIRILISSASTVLGLLLFALLPTAKVLVVTVCLFGISLGSHDFIFLYVLARLAKDRIRGNLRKACEMTFVAAVLLSLPFYAVALSINQVRIVLLILTFITVFIAFAYPLSKISNNADGVFGPKNPKDKEA